MSKRIKYYLFLIYLIKAISSYTKSISLSLWHNFQTNMISAHCSFHQRLNGRYARLYLDLSANITSVEESTDYNINTINITQSQYNSFDEAGMLFYKDTLYSSDTFDCNLPSFQFLLKKVNEPGKTAEGKLALSRSNDSFLNQLYLQGIISNRIISLSDRGISFGSILNQDYVINKAPLIDHCNQWACNIFGIFLGKISSLPDSTNHIDISQYNHMAINLPLILESLNYTDIVLPYSYAKTFRDRYLSDKIAKGDCFIQELPDEISYKCKRHVFENTSIYLILEEVLVDITNKDLEIISRRSKEIEYSIPILFKKSINVGMLGLKNAIRFNVVLNEEDKTIGFSSLIPSYKIDNVRRIMNNDDALRYYRYGYVITGIVLLLGIGIEVYLKTRFTIY